MKRHFITYFYIISNWTVLLNVTARLKICPIYLKAACFFTLKYKNQRNFFHSITEKPTTLSSCSYVPMTESLPPAFFPKTSTRMWITSGLCPGMGDSWLQAGVLPRQTAAKTSSGHRALSLKKNAHFLQSHGRLSQSVSGASKDSRMRVHSKGCWASINCNLTLHGVLGLFF